MKPMKQTLIDFTAARFDGDDYVHDRDHQRLSGQILRVYDCMLDATWRTLREIEESTGDPQASISAQLRNLRKPKFGGHKVERRYLGDGLYNYKLIVR